ncbi:MAG: HEAT repeat domain-containing protein [Planctomycetaceae bacterium]|nr:HEAT repeat domain-containing protein [Planctomycetaceae bacterium]
MRHAAWCVAVTVFAVPAFGQFPDDFGPFPLEDPFEEAIEAEEAVEPGDEVAPNLVPEIAPADSAPLTAAELLQRSDDVSRSAADVKKLIGDPPPAVSKTDVPLRLVPEDLHLGRDYARQVRYLAMRVWLVNGSAKPVTVPRESFRLITRGNELKPGIPARQGLTRLPAGPRFIELPELSKTGPVTVPPHAAIALQVGFADLPGSTEVPEMTLRLPVGGDMAEVDLNAYSLGLMALQIERLGPRGLLGLVTVGGEITPVGAGQLATTLERLANDKTTRLVLTWGENAPAVPPDLSNWLVQSSLGIDGTPANDGQHPVLAGAIRELHLAAFPAGTGVPNYGGPRRVHRTLAAAVTAALGTAFQTMPLDELLREIEGGHVLTRPAAIAAGGRLPSERLPMLIELTSDADVDIAKAAVVALRGFGTQPSIDRLVELAKDAPLPVRAAAVESLAASRFGVGHEALRALLEGSVDGAPLIPPQALVPVLANYPRPLWGDALYKLAMQGEPAVRAEALAALAKLGHPELTVGLEAAIESDDDKLRTRAFSLLARRGDPESMRMAAEYTRRHLASRPPTREMFTLLLRTKDPQVVPLLIERLGDEGANRSDLIRLLSQIGGLEIRDTLEAVYPTLEPPVQAVALGTLAQLRSPKFYDFAEAALASGEPALVSVAQQQLQVDGGQEAVALLTRTLFESDNDMAVSYAAQGLGGIATPEARAAIRKAAHRDDERGQAAAREWVKLITTSAGSQPFQAAMSARQREDWKQAVERYTDAIELDPQLIDAWSGRANANMQLTDYQAARADYEKTLELDPADSAAVTCLGILRVFDGRVEEGLSFVRDRSAEFTESELFAYNTACLYAVASERLEKTDAARAERLRVDAVKELHRAVELGMTAAEHVSWMRKDPDLKSLHGRPDFEKAVAAAERAGDRGKRRAGEKR